MANVLYIYENEMPTVSLMKEGIKFQGFGQRVKSRYLSVKELQRDDFKDVDILVLIRPTEVLSYRVACWAKKAGRTVITFCDDDLYHAPTYSALNKSRVSFFRKTLLNSDIVWSCSPRIAEKYKQYTFLKRSVLTDTVVREEDIFTHTGGNEKVKIVYAAGPSHSVLFEENVGPILNELYKKSGTQFSLTFVGVHPKLPALECRDAEIHFIPLMPLNEYRKYMRSENFDIGLAPLHTDEFSKCKYFNKFLEYSMFGIMGIYSDTEPYTYVVRNRDNGLLVPNKPDLWLRALTEAIQGRSFRAACAENAQDTIRNRFSIEANQKKFMEQLPEFFQDHTEEGILVHAVPFALARIEYQLRHSLLFLITSTQYFQKNGFQNLLEKVKAHIFHRKAFSRQN